MWDILYEKATPYLVDIILMIITIISLMIMAALAELRRRVLNWIDSKKNKDDRELLHHLAEEAFSFAETVFNKAGGTQKLQEAMTYVSGQLKKRGIEVSESEIRGAVEKAVLEFNKSKVKQNGE